ncbi:DUF1800 family protein [Actinoplanes sp. L3-i22]|uniref:DUF1800 domain-containing protein n=1 Tax=Actinoplanes sp. L3-i22 TaxID=2836373 RepID=UPI001C772746|nr:DUF1800 domain-containing protein [Actinoplanes sp. L3-i22]BCY08144.1 hypothetical protein L3i22_032320 [Actinoplanes sp. L3-i22]
MTERTRVSHLLRRLTFGPTAGEVDAAVKVGFDATLRTLIRPPGPVPEPELGAEPDPKDRQARQKQAAAALRWWLGQLAAGGAAEKLTFFWHGHWATSVQKVRSGRLMLGQLATFRKYGFGDTSPLVRAMLRDPALILWLDGQKNTRRAPNENLARELMELFTLGIGAYTEADVKAGAKVLTGWRVDRKTGKSVFVDKKGADGPVTLLGRTGTFDVDDYAGLLVDHPAHLPFLAHRLWIRYASATAPSEAAVARITAAGRNASALLTALCGDPEFEGTNGTLVKQPVEWLIGATRQLGLPVPQQALADLRGLGQVPMRPPSVGGWPVGVAWLTTSATVARLRAAQRLAAAAKTEVKDPEALANLLVVDGWSDRTLAVLRGVKDPRKLLAIGLASPEYTVH